MSHQRHSGKYTRNSKPQRPHLVNAIERGLSKIQLFFTGIPSTSPVNLNQSNPFAGVIRNFLNNKKGK